MPRRSGWSWLVPLVAVALALASCSHFGNGMLEISPAVYPDCQAPDIAVRVTWDATAVVKGGGVQLLVYKPGRQPKLWLQAAAKGEAETGQWASDGWTVILRDEHGKLLATRTLQTTACPEPGGYADR